METFTVETMRKLLSSSLRTAALDKGVWKDRGEGPGTTEGEFLSWLTIRDQVESVWTDVQRVRSHSLVRRDIPIYGNLYDVKMGRLKEVAEAAQIRKAAGQTQRL